MKSSLQVILKFLFFQILKITANSFFLSTTISQAQASISRITQSISPASEKILLVGESYLIEGRQSITLGTQDFLELRPQKNGTLVFAKKTGETLLKIGSQYQRIQVLRYSQSRTFDRLKKFASSTLGFQVSLESAYVKLSGQLQSIQELKRLEDLCKVETCEFRSSFKVPDHLRTPVQEFFRLMLRDYSIISHQIIWEPEIRIVLSQKTVSTERQKSKNSQSRDVESLEPLGKRLDQLGVVIDIRDEVLNLAPSIEMQLMILEANKSSLERFGISWPQSYSAQILPKNAQLDELALSAQFLESNGFARVLASPRILARSGEDAEFLAGGEIPIRVSGYKTQDIIWKRYGILMKMNAQVDLSQKMSIQIETEISSIDRSVTADGVPGFKTNRVKSHFDLNGPQTIALSGLIRAEEGTSQEGLLGLQHLPILGSLFASKEFQRQQTELIILVRPRLPQGL